MTDRYRPHRLQLQLPVGICQIRCQALDELLGGVSLDLAVLQSTNLQPVRCFTAQNIQSIHTNTHDHSGHHEAIMTFEKLLGLVEL